MNYNMAGFWLFYAGVYFLYWRLDHRRQNRLLLVASYAFYAWWDYRFLFLILLSTAIDYVGGLGVAGVEVERARLRRIAAALTGSALLLCSHVDYGGLMGALRTLDARAALTSLPHRWTDLAVAVSTLVACVVYGRLLPSFYALPAQARRQRFLTVSMVANLAILGFFKYFDFFIASADRALAAFGLGHVGVSPLGILLPAGISFYTFQAMSYTIDIYRGDAEPTRSFIDFALFVCFFPHLVAGPIMRAHTLMPQVVRPRARIPNAAEEGLLLVVLGLFKKVVIADNLAPVVNAVFYRAQSGHGPPLTGSDVLVGLYAFAFQIYGDFSGYSSIARGISKWLGFELVVNFRMPYLAQSPSDFWRRWHVSLSTWLRDYLYIPLGGSRRGTMLTYRNLMITMLLGGLWHGASWTFVVWGLYHGVLLCAFRAAGVPDEARAGPLYGVRRFARIVAMFHITCLGWLLFRADSFATVAAMVHGLAARPTVSSFAVSALAYIAFFTSVLVLLEWTMDGETCTHRFLRAKPALQLAAYGYLAAMILFFQAQRAYEFIYFQF